MAITALHPITARELRVAAAGVVALPIEQTCLWDRFEETQHHRLWGHFSWTEDGKTVALISLWVYQVRGFRYLWARNGPVWLKEASPEREQAFRSDLLALVRSYDPKIVWVRLHAWFKAPDLTEPLRMITFDRTVVIDTTSGTPDGIAQTMTKEGRRAVRRASKRMEEGHARVVEETGLSREAFTEYYQIMEETARRDGFRPHPPSFYHSLLDALGSDHARLFGVRVATDAGTDRLVCWDLVLVHDHVAAIHYGASCYQARDVLGPDALDFRVACILGAEGVKGVDLMGAHSSRVPQLYTVGRYKRRFASAFTDVAGAWDMPVQTRRFKALGLAYRGLCQGRQLRARLVNRGKE